MSSERFLVEHRVGRLLTARVFELRSREDADDYAREIGIHVLRAPRETRLILCADHRPVAVYPQPAADRLTELFVKMNVRLERVAILVARSNAVLAMQLHRIVREAGMEARRVCYTSAEAEAHLAPVLEPQELDALRAFLDELSALPPPSAR